ncbi:GAF and ANTAR domain-containing protein [Streptomyces cylindrosporus]|uniref:GAF and ANTAR domain-containing protein n=1 Tax=Streptomyces cylindrosporus TaxID=2927583 RepID=A0ABS9YC83_9ACTN|nr:GAF and ANTAR domain-containing protein [Streptomyces cylindrosporus]MCI3274843.1 GAF and ANTAR domain-containing protein [Streptomyces cylindrosporus]
MAVRPHDERHGFPGDEPRSGGDGTGPSGDETRGSRPAPGVDRIRAAEVVAEEMRGARPEEIPARLCRLAARLVPVSGASVSLRSDGTAVRISASGEAAVHLAEVQSTLGDGPCQAACAAGEPVLANDLTAGRDAGRWPVFAQQATAAGVLAAYSVPLGPGGDCFGTFDLYRDTPGELTEEELRVVLLVAGVMTVALMDIPWDEYGDGEGERWLEGLAADHEVNQATGVVMAQLGVDADVALTRLRARAFARDRTVVELARDVVARRERFDRD